MADINTPQAIQFCNTQIRPAADKFAQLYREAKRIQDEYNALGMSTTIPNTTDTVIDGAVTDGRPVITGQLVTAFVGGLKQFTDTMEANANQLLDLTLQISPNPGN